MKLIIVQFTTSGVRNLEKDITLDFSDYGLSKNIDLSHSNIKGIYGTNGSGKTSLLLSFYLLGQLGKDRNFLATKKSYLDRILNKKTRAFHGRVVFSTYDEKTKKRLGTFAYEIRVQKKAGEYLIESEKFAKIIGRTINEAEKPVFETHKGKLLFYAGNDEHERREADEKTVNLLLTNPFFTLFSPTKFSKMKEETQKSEHDQATLSEEGFLSLYLYLNSLSFFIDEEDLHINPTPAEMGINEILSSNISAQEKGDALLSSANGLLGNLFSKKIMEGSIVVPKNRFSEFQDKIKRLEDFIRLFKSHLRGIKIERKVISQSYLCNLIFEYPDYSIDATLESSGIRRLIRLFRSLLLCARGANVFIDEIDTCIHDVYLEKLIEFFERYGKGQLTFTSHNINLMNQLKSLKHSIDFLNDENELVSWTRSGRLNPANRYREGWIPKNALNIDAINFLPIFGE